MPQYTLVETPIEDIKLGVEFLYLDGSKDDKYWQSATLDEDGGQDGDLVFWTSYGAMGDLDELPDKVYLVLCVW